ncbi:MAG: hypothetical protein AB7U29_12160 [Desulfobulbus sp.]
MPNFDVLVKTDGLVEMQKDWNLKLVKKIVSCGERNLIVAAFCEDNILFGEEFLQSSHTDAVHRRFCSTILSSKVRYHRLPAEQGQDRLEKKSRLPYNQHGWIEKSSLGQLCIITCKEMAQ